MSLQWKWTFRQDYAIHAALKGLLVNDIVDVITGLLAPRMIQSVGHEQIMAGIEKYEQKEPLIACISWLYRRGALLRTLQDAYTTKAWPSVVYILWTFPDYCALCVQHSLLDFQISYLIQSVIQHPPMIEGGEAEDPWLLDDDKEATTFRASDSVFHYSILCFILLHSSNDMVRDAIVNVLHKLCIGNNAASREHIIPAMTVLKSLQDGKFIHPPRVVVREIELRPQRGSFYWAAAADAEVKDMIPIVQDHARLNFNPEKRGLDMFSGSISVSARTNYNLSQSTKLDDYDSFYGIFVRRGNNICNFPSLAWPEVRKQLGQQLLRAHEVNPQYYALPAEVQLAGHKISCDDRMQGNMLAIIYHLLPPLDEISELARPPMVLDISSAYLAAAGVLIADDKQILFVDPSDLSITAEKRLLADTSICFEQIHRVNTEVFTRSEMKYADAHKRFVSAVANGFRDLFNTQWRRSEVTLKEGLRLLHDCDNVQQLFQNSLVKLRYSDICLDEDGLVLTPMYHIWDILFSSLAIKPDSPLALEACANCILHHRRHALKFLQRHGVYCPAAATREHLF